MKLQILIPHYTAEEKEIKLLLDSIAMQQAVDFSDVGVIIAFDGDEATPLPDWNFPFQVMRMHLDHKGVSATRNALLDAATAEYIMLCDEDDMFCHMCALNLIFREMEKPFDAMISVFLEQTNFKMFVPHEWDSVFVHGKVYSLDYLNRENLRFRDDFTLHEDIYLNIRALNLTKKIRYCKTPFYLWRWRDTSVVRSYKDFCKVTYDKMLQVYDAIVEDFAARGEEERANFYAGMIILDAYDIQDERILWFWKKHKDRLAKMDKRERAVLEKRAGKYNAEAWLCAIEQK